MRTGLTLRSPSAVTHFRERMGEGNTEGLSFIMAADMTLQTVLAAKSLLTAIAGTVEWLLPYSTRRDRDELRSSSLLTLLSSLNKGYREMECGPRAC